MAALFPLHVEVPPPPLLAPFVECYWNVSAAHGELPEEPEVQRVLPDGSITLMFNVGAPHRLHDPRDPSRWTLSRRCWLAGFQSEYLVISPTDGTQMVGVRFRPGGVFPFFGIPLSEFRDRVIEMDLVWGTEGEEVCEQLAAASTLEQRFECLSRFLLARAGSRLSMEQRVDYCLRQFRLDPERPLREIVPELGITRRQLGRIFHTHLGTNPKTAQRVERFQGAVRMLNHGGARWLEVALDSGYYDQAHFNGEFKGFTGLTPTEYLSKRTPYLNFAAL